MKWYYVAKEKDGVWGVVEHYELDDGSTAETEEFMIVSPRGWEDLKMMLTDLLMCMGQRKDD
jgi:hypothetical protein